MTKDLLVGFSDRRLLKAKEREGDRIRDEDAEKGGWKRYRGNTNTNT